MSQPHPILGPRPRDMDEVVERLLKLEATVGAIAPPGLKAAIQAVEQSISTYGVPIPPDAVATLLAAGRELLRVTAPTSEVPTSEVSGRQDSSEPPEP